MKKGYLISPVLFLLGASVLAEPVVTGSTITWPDDGWYQVQGAESFVTFCDGTAGCTVPDGSYIVINHTTGERWENVEVDSSTASSDPVQDPIVEEDPVAVAEPTPDGLTLTASSIAWPDDGWYQVQSADDYSTICEGGVACEVPPGTYIVINHSTGERWDDIVITSAGMSDDSMAEDSDTEEPVAEDPVNDDPVVDDTGDESIDDVDAGASTVPELISGNTLQWADDGWYQVQSFPDYATICEGGTSCAVTAGTYIVINLTTGERWEGIEVSADSEQGSESEAAGDNASGDADPTSDESEPQDSDTDTLNPVAGDSDTPMVDGLTISWVDDGWYQVQSSDTFETVCEGGQSCVVPGRGNYIVVNHTSGMRWLDVAVYDTPGVWFGSGSFGESVFVIGPAGELFGLADNGNGLFETVFGSADEDEPAERFLHRASLNPAHGGSFNFFGDVPSSLNGNELDRVDYFFNVVNDGQQIDNTSIAGNFSLAFATENDIGSISVGDIIGSWEARTAFCGSGCDLTLSMSFAADGFVEGMTQFNQAGELGLAGAVSEASTSGQYLNVSFVWNGDRKTGVIYHDRNSDGIVLNTVGPDGDNGNQPMSALLLRQ